MGESTLLSSHPNIVLVCAGNRVDDIARDPIGGDNSSFSFLQPSQTTMAGRNPDAPAGVNMQWPRALRIQLGKSVRNETPVSQSLKAARTTDPYISLSVLE